MSIATKFAYLTETKNLIREAINAKGGTLTTDSTFRSYAAAITALSGDGSSGGSEGTTVTKYSAWLDDFSGGITNVANDSNSWYELSESSGRLSAILREPDTSATLACFSITPDKKIDLTDGAYLSIDIIGIQDGTTTVSSEWNNYTCVGLRLKDSSGIYSNWVEIDAHGLGATDGIGNVQLNLAHADISSYLGSVDRANIVAIEIELIGWPTSTNITYKTRDKGVYIDNFMLANSASATATITALSGDGSSGGSVGTTVTKYSAWLDDFSGSITNVANDSNSWYELSESSGRLSAILREPDTSATLACFSITPDKKIDLTDGAYLSIDIIGIQDGTATVSSGWNNYTCVGMRLKDKDGAYSSWIEIDANGLGAADGIGPTTVTISHADISSYLGDVDRANVAAIEIQLIGWPDSTTITYKARDKGVYIDNFMLANSASATATTTIEVPKTYDRTTATYGTLSTTDFNDAATVYQAVNTAQGDRVMFIVRHSERDSATGKDVGLNANGVSLVTQYAGSKLTGTPFATVTDDAYYSTNVKRTVDTSYLVGNARSNSNMPLNTALGSDWESCTVVDHSGDTESSIASVAVTPGPHTYFNDSLTGGTDWNTAKNYYTNNQAECTTKCEAAINWLAEDSEGHPFTFLSSHDLCMVPFVCWATGNGNFFSSWNNDYDSNPTGWLNYLAGVAVIVHTDGSWEVYPVKLLDSGKFQ